MKDLLERFICLGRLLTLIVPCAAQQPVTPPFTHPQEHWTMIYDDYHMLPSNKKDDDLLNITREVTIVKNGNDIFIMGIFDKYPNAWIKGTINCDEVEIENKQYITQDNEESIYSHWGCSRYSFSSGNTFAESSICFSPDYYSTRTPRRFTITNNGNTMTARVCDYSVDEYSAFWYDNNPYGTVDFTEGYYHDKYGTHPYGEFPEIDYRVNVSFEKIDESSIGNIIKENVNDSTSPMYDLQGRRVNPETAGPGIYIHNHKKIIL